MTWRGGTGEAAGGGQGRAELVRGVEAEGARPETLRVGQGGGASGEAQDAATSPPPFSPMSPTQQLTRAFSALPIIDTSSSSSDPPSSPGRAEQVAQQRAASLDALTMQAESKAKSPKSRPDGKAKQRSPDAQRKPERDRTKRQGDPDGAAPEPAPMLITPAAASAPSAPTPTPPGREREKKKLNLPSPGTGASRSGVSTPSASAAAATGQFTCPYCPAQLDEAPLIEHVLSEHMDGNPRVVCPMCASRPGGDPKMRSSNFQGHLQARHGGQPPQRRPRKVLAAPPSEVEVHLNDDDEQEDEQQQEEQLRWVLITTNANRLRDRSLEGLWDYVLTFDPASRPAKCVACSARLGPNDATCMLACGHSFHSGCLAENDPDPECPICLSMGGDAVMKD